jgi:hypothetical protein
LLMSYLPNAALRFLVIVLMAVVIKRVCYQ